MQIQINTDHNIEVHEALAAQLRDTVATTLHRFSERITRVEMHLSDENAGKTGQNDKRCLLEARLQGHQPIAASHESDSLGQAVDGAADKLARSIESTLGRAERPTAVANWAEPTEPE
jgi:ribosomal subunit interface protein